MFASGAFAGLLNGHTLTGSECEAVGPRRGKVYTIVNRYRLDSLCQTSTKGLERRLADLRTSFVHMEGGMRLLETSPILVNKIRHIPSEGMSGVVVVLSRLPSWGVYVKEWTRISFERK